MQQLTAYSEDPWCEPKTSEAFPGRRRKTPNVPRHRRQTRDLLASTEDEESRRKSQRHAREDGSPEPGLFIAPPEPLNPLDFAFHKLEERLNRRQKTADEKRHVARALLVRSLPKVDSFAQFLEEHARVRQSSGYVPFHFEGREIMREIVTQIDHILGSDGAPALTDATLAICGGAQFGKTVLMLNFLAYVVAVRFRNLGYYLPDDDLVQGIVDGKLRPDVLDQIPWLARMIQCGQSVNESGRAVNRKGAFLCTDGERTALAYLRGLGKIPTTFSMDVIVQDEKDDLPPARARFLAGRMSASDLRFLLSIGTQRYHGAGQNQEFERGSQHVGMIRCSACGAGWNPEENWPAICRRAVTGIPRRDDPQLSVDGNFGSPLTFGNSATAGDSLTGELVTPFYLSCPACGGALDRGAARFVPRQPERIAQREWSYRVSQLLIPAIDLASIVAAWRDALRDPGLMTAFCTDRLALPRSTSQALDPAILERARRPYALSATTTAPLVYAGLDTGDRCWFVARALDRTGAFPTRRLLWCEMISAERARSRVAELCETLAVRILLIDANPLRDLARDLCFTRHGLETSADLTSQPAPDAGRVITFHRAASAKSQHAPLIWNGPREHWRGLRAAAVEFTQRAGQGVRHKLGRTSDGRLYPLIACEREEVIERVIWELLTDREGIREVRDGAVRVEPSFHLPTRDEANAATLAAYERHLLAGSRRATDPDGAATGQFVDRCENHYLLATAYAALAEQLDDGALDSKPLPLGGLHALCGMPIADQRRGHPLARRIDG